MELKLCNVSKRFDGFVAVGDVSFTVSEGEFVCILGPSGCGKTTLLRMIGGLEQPTSGEILLDGKPFVHRDTSVGFVFQEYGLFPWRSVLKNVEFGLEIRGVQKEERERIAKRYIELVGLSKFESYYPHELSGGMKQRVGIARALAIDPKLLLMDEPFGATDAQTRNILQEELVRIWTEEHKTVLYVTHSVDEAIFLGDRVLVLTASPSRVKGEFRVDIPRPRDRTGPDANRLRKAILEQLASEIMRGEG
ncbi:MAG: ABC transporter ATP-binding protein [Methermicoccaceae archaeon]